VSEASLGGQYFDKIEDIW